MITISGLNKSFGSLEVLRNLNLEIKNGTITYLVGPNASGKTTLIKSILGLVKPDNGSIYIDAEKLNGNHSYRSKIGYMPQIASFPDNLTVTEIIKMIKNLRDDYKSYDEELIDMLRLSKEFNKRLKNLSGGTKQKVNAVIAFLFNPEILILDEPTAGLDPVSSSILKDKIIKENKQGKTIIFTSHILSELEELAEDVIFLLEGETRFQGTMIDLINSTGKQNLERSIASIMTGN
ncbi:MAG TPA: ABC transporter ATP-binding protein [Melioribacteraceae bacterium]|nr:ABC transporter ATP-binding protein [Melioribacteraceae bacterium]